MQVLRPMPFPLLENDLSRDEAIHLANNVLPTMEAMLALLHSRQQFALFKRPLRRLQHTNDGERGFTFVAGDLNPRISGD